MNYVAGNSSSTRSGRAGKGREGKGSKLWLGCERCLSVVNSNGGKIKVKCGCVSS
jgi:hypothetical protein